MNGNSRRKTGEYEENKSSVRALKNVVGVI
jgi:hypothetical protein